MATEEQTGNEDEEDDEDIEEEERETLIEGDVDILNHHIVNQSEPAIVHQTPQLPNLALAALQRMSANSCDDSPDDFRPLKKRKRHDTKKLTNDNEDIEDNEGQTCSICFEPWSNSGNHRISSLKCGHLFGYSCIEKWLKGQDGRCPQCNCKAKKKDIRVIFAKSISVVDTTERDRALKELEEEKLSRILAQKAEAQAILQYQLAKTECDRLKRQLDEVKKQLEVYTSSNGHPVEQVHKSGMTTSMSYPHSSDGGRFNFIKKINISNGRARVMANDPILGMLVASKPSSNQLFPGWGLTKVSLMDLKPSEFVRIHENCIRDVHFSPRGDGLTVTAGMDKTMKLTSMHSNNVVQSYSLPVPAWACCWNEDDNNYVYCGLSNGNFMTFDLRQTAGHVKMLQRPDNHNHIPVTSLTYVPLCHASSLNCSGVLMGTLDGAVFWESERDVFTPHLLEPLSGSCTCLSFDTSTRHCLASFRPSNRTPQSKLIRHIVCELRNTPINEPFTCHPVHEFTGGSVYRLLSRSLLFQRPESSGRLLVAYGDEASKSTQICDVSTTSKLQKLETDSEPCLDISLVEGGTTSLLTLLTESKLHFYQWQ